MNSIYTLSKEEKSFFKYTSMLVKMQVKKQVKADKLALKGVDAFVKKMFKPVVIRKQRVVKEKKPKDTRVNGLNLTNITVTLQTTIVDETVLPVQRPFTKIQQLKEDAKQAKADKQVEKKFQQGVIRQQKKEMKEIERQLKKNVVGHVEPNRLYKKVTKPVVQEVKPVVLPILDVIVAIEYESVQLPVCDVVQAIEETTYVENTFINYMYTKSKTFKSQTIDEYFALDTNYRVDTTYNEQAKWVLPKFVFNPERNWQSNMSYKSMVKCNEMYNFVPTLEEYLLYDVYNYDHLYDVIMSQYTFRRLDALFLEVVNQLMMYTRYMYSLKNTVFDTRQSFCDDLIKTQIKHFSKLLQNQEQLQTIIQELNQLYDKPSFANLFEYYMIKNWDQDKLKQYQLHFTNQIEHIEQDSESDYDSDDISD